MLRSSLTPTNLARFSWAEFKEKLLEKYCSQRALENIEDEFRAIKKGNLPVSYYAKQFLEKLSLVKHLDPDENSKIKAYLKSLSVDMSTTVRISKVATLHEAIEESLILEDDITEAREERYQAREKRKGEESTEPTRTKK